MTFTSSTIQRLLLLSFFLVILSIGVHYLLLYLVAFYINFEYLNYNKNYRELRYSTTYNWLFVCFVGFIILVRGNPLKESIEYHLNTLEHLFFSAIICLIITIYFKIFGWYQMKYSFVVWITFLGFNSIGLINELFQNTYQHLPLWQLDPGDIKDITVNLLGSFLFVIASLYLKTRTTKA